MFAGMNTGATPSLAPHHMALIPQERLAEIQKEIDKAEEYLKNLNQIKGEVYNY